MRIKTQIAATSGVLISCALFFGVSLAGSAAETDSQRERADLSCDGATGAADAIVSLTDLTGLDPSLPAGCPGPGAPASPACVVAGTGASGAVLTPNDFALDQRWEGYTGVVDLTWEDASVGESCFVLERSGSLGSGWAVASVLPSGTTACTDWEAQEESDGGFVHYRVYAASADARSEASDVAEAYFVSPTLFPSPALPTPVVTPVPNGVICGGEQIELSPKRADFNCSGNVTPKDALLLLAWVAGLEPVIPDGCPAPDSLVATAVG